MLSLTTFSQLPVAFSVLAQDLTGANIGMLIAALILFAVLMFGFVYGATLIGQGLGADQMYKMRSLVDRACVDALRAPLDEPSIDRE